MTEPRPFTVVGGFLGAGKTTLVNRILGAAGGTRYAVMVNDFGAINVDAALIAAHDGQTMALTNGCICCSLADGFVTAMLRLMRTPERFDHVIVEASGVSEPDRIMDVARLDPLLRPDAIVVLADAETVAAHLADPRVSEIVAAQIASADILLATKADLVAATALDGAKAALRRLNDAAPILRCRTSEVPVGALLGTLSHEARMAAHAHPATFYTRTLVFEAPLDRGVLDAFAGSLPAAVLRGKGVLAFRGEEDAFEWQRVGARMTLAPLGRPALPRSELVLIGTEPLDGLDPFPLRSDR